MFRRRRTPSLDPEQVAAIVDAEVALARHLSSDDRRRLLDDVEWLMADKHWEVLPPLEHREEITVVVAANAVLPLLRLDRSLYRNVRSIIVRESSVAGMRDWEAEADGVTSTGMVETVGETLDEWGPLAIAWDAALAESRNPRWGGNVVIHEFAHKIDMADGYSDGSPPVQGEVLDEWNRVVADEFERTTARDSDEVLRDYAWTNQAEFFAVSTEVFFCTPRRLLAAKPDLYNVLARVYLQDPAARMTAVDH